MKYTKNVTFLSILVYRVPFLLKNLTSFFKTLVFTDDLLVAILVSSRIQPINQGLLTRKIPFTYASYAVMSSINLKTGNNFNNLYVIVNASTIPALFSV